MCARFCLEVWPHLEYPLSCSINNSSVSPQSDIKTIIYNISVLLDVIVSLGNNVRARVLWRQGRGWQSCELNDSWILDRGHCLLSVTIRLTHESEDEAKNCCPDDEFDPKFRFFVDEDHPEKDKNDCVAHSAESREQKTQNRETLYYHKNTFRSSSLHRVATLQMAGCVSYAPCIGIEANVSLRWLRYSPVKKI